MPISKKIINYLWNKLQSEAIGQIKEIIAPHLRRRLSKLNQKKSIVYCKEDNVYILISIRRTNLDTDGFADRLANLNAKGIVLSVCTGVCAGYDKIATVREEAFRRSEQTYNETVKKYSLGMERIVLKRTELGETDEETKGKRVDDENRKKEEETEEGENGLKEEEPSLVLIESHNYHQDLAILRAMFDFKIRHGHLPYQNSDQLHNHNMKSIPNLDIRGNDLTSIF
ncbi:hypothetical protein KY290_032313 [Solanum tuberosum]|uniref:Uncharacterized protein n=1 Tax=Solanum tuberosum TaxID=4113 RepID=A0ABQ7UF49_SOLTU|nr:hypothetical protein KY290_032313 [Solanum tuberosum]